MAAPKRRTKDVTAIPRRAKDVAASGIKKLRKKPPLQLNTVGTDFLDAPLFDLQHHQANLFPQTKIRINTLEKACQNLFILISNYKNIKKYSPTTRSNIASHAYVFTQAEAALQRCLQQLAKIPETAKTYGMVSSEQPALRKAVKELYQAVEAIHNESKKNSKGEQSDFWKLFSSHSPKWQSLRKVACSSYSMIQKKSPATPAREKKSLISRLLRRKKPAAKRSSPKTASPDQGKVVVFPTQNLHPQDIANRPLPATPKKRKR